jgi:hypothetical protein
MKGKICVLVLPQIILSIIATVLISKFNADAWDEGALKALISEWEIGPIVDV